MVRLAPVEGPRVRTSRSVEARGGVRATFVRARPPLCTSAPRSFEPATFSLTMPPPEVSVARKTGDATALYLFESLEMRGRETHRSATYRSATGPASLALLRAR
jgi:hypothetical protein